MVYSQAHHISFTSAFPFLFPFIGRTHTLKSKPPYSGICREAFEAIREKSVSFKKKLKETDLPYGFVGLQEDVYTLGGETSPGARSINPLMLAFSAEWGANVFCWSYHAMAFCYSSPDRRTLSLCFVFVYFQPSGLVKQWNQRTEGARNALEFTRFLLCDHS